MGATAAQDCVGVIANCISIGDNGKGALCNSSSNNSGAAVIQNCYWLDTLGSGSGAMSEDDMKDLETKTQKMTDKYIADIDKAVDEKSKEIMTV